MALGREREAVRASDSLDGEAREVKDGAVGRVDGIDNAVIEVIASAFDDMAIFQDSRPSVKHGRYLYVY